MLAQRLNFMAKGNWVSIGRRASTAVANPLDSAVVAEPQNGAGHARHGSSNTAGSFEPFRPTCGSDALGEIRLQAEVDYNAYDKVQNTLLVKSALESFWCKF